MPRILMIEDDEMNRDMLSRRLQRRGYDVLVAVDGREGVAAAASQRPDLILMESNLPVLDGWQTMRLMKDDAVTQTIPIIILTAFTDAEERAREIGCDEFDTKPVDMPRLLGKIERLLQSRAALRAGA